MSQRVTIDGGDMRARLRSSRHASRPASYAQRPAAQHSRQLFQDVLTTQQATTIPQILNIPAPQSTIAEPPKAVIPAPVIPQAAAQYPASSWQNKPPTPHRAFMTIPHKPQSSKVLMRQTGSAATQK
jgi:hypothetical protein